jgi:putative transposase
MDADFCVMALEEAIARFWKAGDLKTDQGSQFTGFAFTSALKDAGIRIPMDGRGRWMDNVFIERLWRSLKYECVSTMPLRRAVSQKLASDVGSATIMPTDSIRSFGGRTPDEVYATQASEGKLAA